MLQQTFFFRLEHSDPKATPRMHCFRILSIFVAIFLFVSLGACLVSLWSLNWWVGEFEAVLPVTNETQIADKYDLHWLFSVRYGLTKVCWKALQPRRVNDPDNYLIIPEMRYCSAHEIDFPWIPSVRRDMNHFRNILICMAVGIIFNVMAFIFAFFNLPCIRRLKKCLMLLTIIMSVLAAVAVLIGLFIANDTLYYDAKFMKRMRQTSPEFGDDVSSKTIGYLDRVFAKVYDAELSEVFEKGYSFVVACIAEVFLLLAIIFAIIENCCYTNRPEREYLVEDDVDKKKARL